MNNNVEEVKTRLNIVDIVGEYVRLTKAGTNWKGLCPFHGEKSPSFMVNEEKQIYHCFGCTKGGDVISFVMEIESLQFREALKILAEKAGVELEQYKSEAGDSKKRILAALEAATKFYQEQLKNGSAKAKISQYLRERGLSEESVEKFRLGFAPNGWDNILKHLLQEGFSVDEIAKTGLLVEKSADAVQDPKYKTQDISRYYDRFRERIMFPICDAMGAVIGYSARVAPGADESQAKYINSPETLVYHKSKALYGLWQAKNAIKQKNYVLLVEGNLDVIASAQAGLTNTVAVSGTALTSEQVQLLKRYTENIAMLFDMDSAGQQAAKKSADLCFEKGLNVKIVTLADGKDAADVAQKDPNLLLKAVASSSLAMDYFFAEALKKFNKNTADGKQNIAKEVLAHVWHLANPIERAHWIKKIAHEVDVEEKVITDVLKGVAAKPVGQSVPQSAPKAAPQASSSFQKRSDVLRDSLVGVILSSAKIWQEMAGDERAMELASQDAMLAFVLKQGAAVGFSFEQLLANIKDEKSINRLRNLYFEAKYSFSQEGIDEYEEDELRNLVADYVTQFSKELQKERLHAIIKEIEIAEHKGDKETLAKLMSQFAKLSQEIQ